MRLSALLARFTDIPGLNIENEAVARKLVSFLPDRTAPRTALQIDLSQGRGPTWIVVTMAGIAILVTILANILIPGASWLSS